MALVSATALFLVLAAPPYLYAFMKSGNPVFPFANTIFHSPYFDQAAFADPRFATPISWRTPYDAAFRSGIYVEGQGGSSGFQYWIFLIPALLVVRQRAARLLAVIACIGAVALFASVSNLRYVYPALPLISIVIGDLFAIWQYAIPVAVAAAALNTCFLAASGWYQNDFVFFRKSQAQAYLDLAMPEHTFIDRLNQTSPGEPVAFFGSDTIAGLHALAYTASWHSNEYWERLRAARTAAEVADILRSLGIRHIIAPVSRQDQIPLFETFLREWVDPDGSPNGRMGLFRLRDSAIVIPHETPVLPPGTYDDLDNRIEYSGAWIHDRQFAEAAIGSITYCDVPGAYLRLTFEGSSVSYIFTKALNRGTARVLIDGEEKARISMYSRRTEWRTQRSFTGLVPGRHTFEIRVLERKDARSSGTFVDLDEIVIE